MLEETLNLIFTVTLILVAINNMRHFAPSPVLVQNQFPFAPMVCCIYFPHYSRKCIWHEPLVIVYSACQTVSAKGTNAKRGKDHLQSEEFCYLHISHLIATPRATDNFTSSIFTLLSSVLYQ